MLLRLRGGTGQRDADVLNRLIMDVTMPALIVQTLTARGFMWSTGISLAATTAARVVGGALAALVVRVLGADRRLPQR